MIRLWGSGDQKRKSIPQMLIDLFGGSSGGFGKIWQRIAISNIRELAVSSSSGPMPLGYPQTIVDS
jgi:hypothetical protein